MAIAETFTASERAERELIRMECRANRHEMRRAPAPPDWTPPRTLMWRCAKRVLHKRCRLCGTWRHIAMNHRGGYLIGYYDWPDWYRREPGEGKMSFDDLRIWEVEQVEAETARTRRRRETA